MEVKTAVESAFRPLRCVAEVWDYDQKLRFKVFGSDDKVVIEILELVIRMVREKNELRDYISSFRERVEEKGFKLLPWSLN